MQRIQKIGDSFLSKEQVIEILKILEDMEVGITLLKEEFKLGMHNSLSEIIRKIDTIMAGSLKRAHGGDNAEEPVM